MLPQIAAAVHIQHRPVHRHLCRTKQKGGQFPDLLWARHPPDGDASQRRRLAMHYQARGTGEHSERTVSPQRLVYYRSNWLLDAWCHKKNELRSFSLDAISRPVVLNEAATDVSPEELDQTLGNGYGIFSGAPQAWARLRFDAQRARWVSGEQWHPDQSAHHEPDGSYVLELPYSDDRELLGDILRHGAACEVLSPPELRHKVAEALRQAAQRYAAG